MSVNPAHAALAGKCPQCGHGALFKSAVGFADRCSACGLDLSRFNVGDGPAAFLTLIIGTIVTGLAMWLELSVRPAWWVHVILWTPLVIVGTVVSLRLSKALLLALEYRHEAQEGRLDAPSSPRDEHKS